MGGVTFEAKTAYFRIQIAPDRITTAEPSTSGCRCVTTNPRTRTRIY